LTERRFEPPDIHDYLVEQLREQLLKDVPAEKVDILLAELIAITEKYAKEIREQRDAETT
jgi:hypothetical protein